MPEAALQTIPWRALPALLVVLLAAWLPGILALRRLAPAPSVLRPLERQFAALSLGLALTGWLAFLLAQLGIFSLPLLAVLWLAATLALAFVARRALLAPTPTPPEPSTSHHLEHALILLWIPVALWLFLRPHEAILGAADAGVYVSLAAQIARHGSILIQDTSLAQLDPALHAAILRPIPDATLTPSYLFPGFNVANAAAGAIIPDFFHFHATWQAVAYALGHAIGGATRPLIAVQSALLMPGLWALLGALAVYLSAYRLLQGAAFASRQRITLFAALALAALSLSAIQVWFARYPVAETLSQYLLWTALWAFSAWLGNRRPLALWGLLAALSFGLLLLTRIDMIFVLALPALAAVWRLSRRFDHRSERAAMGGEQLWFYIPLALLVLHATLHAAFISRPYFNRILGYGEQLLLRTWPVLLLALPIVLLAAWLALRRPAGPGPGTFHRLKDNLYGHLHGRVRSPLLALLALALVALAAYAWFLRPVYGPLPSYSEWYDGQTITLTDRENLVRLGWYLSPYGIWLAIAGAALMVWRANRRTLPVLLVGLFFTILYIWRIQANPHQIYVMRRYVPAVVPFFTVAAAYLLFWLATRRWPATRPRAAHVSLATALLLGLLWLAAIAWSARGFVTRVDYHGLTAQLTRLDHQLAPNSILLFNDPNPITQGDTVGAALHFFFEHDVYSLRQPTAIDDALLAKSIEDWHNSGRTVYWVGAPDTLQRLGIAYETTPAQLTAQALEGSYDHKPTRIIPLTWNLPLNRLQPAP